MAKDGTNRGGSRPGAGRKPKAVAEKYANGNPGGRKLTTLDFGCDTSDLQGPKCPGQGVSQSRRTAVLPVPKKSIRKPGNGCTNADVTSMFPLSRLSSTPCRWLVGFSAKRLYLNSVSLPKSRQAPLSPLAM